MEGEEGPAFNAAHIFFPDGRIEKQKKNHLFPGETDWGTSTYDGLEVFQAPKVKIGIMTCYDAEFPEVARHFMLNGAELILCPSATYTERGFNRVRNCCLARAVENQIYVAECHGAGTLSVPIDLPFTGFGKSCILCPVDDRTMVSNGILVEANVADGELVLVGEIDLDILHQSRESSEATILKDRRPETYKEHYTLL
jgi:predicted amidohydrolase